MQEEIKRKRTHSIWVERKEENTNNGGIPSMPFASSHLFGIRLVPTYHMGGRERKGCEREESHRTGEKRPDVERGGKGGGGGKKRTDKRTTNKTKWASR